MTATHNALLSMAATHKAEFNMATWLGLQHLFMLVNEHNLEFWIRYGNGWVDLSGSAPGIPSSPVKRI